jgi:hypothetical protein
MSRPHAGELPPTPTVWPVDPPPREGATVPQLAGDIQSGLTGDKNPVLDPALAPLGTDDEAAGHPATPQRVSLARHFEGFRRWLGGSRRIGDAHRKSDGQPVGFLAVIGAISVVLLVGVWLVRASPAGP